MPRDRPHSAHRARLLLLTSRPRASPGDRAADRPHHSRLQRKVYILLSSRIFVLPRACRPPLRHEGGRVVDMIPNAELESSLKKVHEYRACNPIPINPKEEPPMFSNAVYSRRIARLRRFRRTRADLRRRSQIGVLSDMSQPLFGHRRSRVDGGRAHGDSRISNEKA